MQSLTQTAYLKSSYRQIRKVPEQHINQSMKLLESLKEIKVREKEIRKLSQMERHLVERMKGTLTLE